MKKEISTACSAVMLIFFMTSPLTACTSLSFKSQEGQIFAANLDLAIPADGLVYINKRGVAKNNLRQNTVGQTLDWTPRYGSVTFSLAGYGYVWSGMNEAGLVISMMELKDSQYPTLDERFPLEQAVWIQYQLDTCSDVECVIQSDSKVRPVTVGPAPDHYLVSSWYHH